MVVLSVAEFAVLMAPAVLAWEIHIWCRFNLASHFLEALPLIDPLHHVTRDAYADVSGKAHSIKYQICGSCAVFKVARGIAGVTIRAATERCLATFNISLLPSTAIIRQPGG
jgi:hypothetical protein